MRFVSMSAPAPRRRRSAGSTGSGERSARADWMSSACSPSVSSLAVATLENDRAVGRDHRREPGRDERRGLVLDNDRGSGDAFAWRDLRAPIDAILGEGAQRVIEDRPGGFARG